MTLSAENRALVERVFAGDLPYTDREGMILSEDLLNRLLDAARTEASPPPPAEGVGEEEHGSSCTDLSCAQAHSPEPSPAGGLDLDALEKVARAADVQNPRNTHARPWAQHGHGVSRANPSNEHIAIAKTSAAAAHIATFDPPTVLGLIAAARLLETPDTAPRPTEGVGKLVEAYISERLPRCYPNAAGRARATAFREILAIVAAAEAASPVLLEGDLGGSSSASVPAGLRPTDEPSATGLSDPERHELECLRHQVGQLEYPCSPHCEGYLRELAMRNGGHRP